MLFRSGVEGEFEAIELRRGRNRLGETTLSLSIFV